MARRRAEPEWLRSLREDGMLDQIAIIAERPPDPPPELKRRGRVIVSEQRWTRAEYLEFQARQHRQHEGREVFRGGERRLSRELPFQPTGRDTREVYDPTGPRDPRWAQAAADGFKRSIAANGKRPPTDEHRAAVSRGMGRSWLPGGKHYEAWERRQAGPKPPRLCDEDGCGQEHFGLGKCRYHYKRLPEVREREARRARERRAAKAGR